MQSAALKGLLAVAIAVAAIILVQVEARAQDLNLMPWPAKLTPGQGRLAITGDFRVALIGYEEPRLEAAAHRLVSRLTRQTGIPILQGVVSDPSGATLVIQCQHAGEAVQTPSENESYRLEVTPEQARLTAATPVGVLRGMETFLQLITLDGQGFSAPAVAIEDHPRFVWRGLMLDVCRHWMPIEVVERTLDAMAAVKMNVFHWHLSENQGFRVESKLFPKLQEMGSDGHYYTQDQVREVIAYARDRGIRVVPEFDMPGHTTAWFVGYPELSSGPGPYQIERRWGVFDPAMDPTRDEVYSFLDKFIGEMAALFPDPYFHVGGDEVNGKQWKRNPKIQAFMHDHGMKSTADLQAYFIGRVQGIVAQHGKKMIGWDEVLSPDLPKDVMIQSWRGQKSLADAAREGYTGILSAGYYLDLMQSAAQHYSVDPMEGPTAGLTPEQKARILGGESCMWVEFATPENVDTRIWPRNAAIAERLWSPEETKDVDSMYRRLAAVNRSLGWIGIPNRPNRQLMLERLTGMGRASNLDTLDSLVEPVKGYAREATHHQYTSLTPYNRLVDATNPESDAARQLGWLVDHRQEQKKYHYRIQELLATWKTSALDVQPAMKQSPLLQPDESIATDVVDLTTAGLQALDFISQGTHPPDSWVKSTADLLDRAAEPHDELLIMIVPPIKKLAEDAQK